MAFTPRQETQQKLWALVYAHASGDDIWPLLLNQFTTDEARTIAHEVPQMLDELFVAAGLDDQTPATAKRSSPNLAAFRASRRACPPPRRMTFVVLPRALSIRRTCPTNRPTDWAPGEAPGVREVSAGRAAAWSLVPVAWR